MKRLLATLGLLLGLLFGLPLAGGARAQAGEDAEIVEPLRQWLGRLFELPADEWADAALRAVATELATAHIARMTAVLQTWPADERAAAGTALDRRDLASRLTRRFLNELAVWRIDSAGTAYDEALLSAWLQPGACRAFESRSAFAGVMHLAQPLAAPQRDVLLAGERALLARWGQPRQALPDRPPLAAQRLMWQAVEALRNGAAVALPMPPLVASQVLGAEPQAPPGASVQCALQQWNLRRVLGDGAALAKPALDGFRYAVLPSALSWYGEPDAPPERDPQAYPAVAQRFEVVGRILLEVTIDAQGRYQQAEVVDRKVNVPGVRGQRPVAFETLLDDGSVARAAAVTYQAPVAAQLQDGRARRRVEFVWTLQ